MNNFYKAVYELTLQIPKGKVTSYGRLAALLNSPRAARAVGYALNSLNKTDIQNIPWQRVINAQGKISIKGDTFRAQLQKKLLEEEGVVFDKNGSIDWNQFGWP